MSDDKHKEYMRRFDKIDNSLNELNTRLFKGNGKEAWDVRLDRLERFKSGSTWFYGVIIIACSGLAVRLIYSIMVR